MATIKGTSKILLDIKPKHAHIAFNPTHQLEQNSSKRVAQADSMNIRVISNKYEETILRELDIKSLKPPYIKNIDKNGTFSILDTKNKTLIDAFPAGSKISGLNFPVIVMAKKSTRSNDIYIGVKDNGKLSFGGSLQQVKSGQFEFAGTLKFPNKMTREDAMIVLPNRKPVLLTTFLASKMKAAAELLKVSYPERGFGSNKSFLTP
jgi:hypothetical protein